MRELKERYLLELADTGNYAEVVGVDWDFPSCGELAAAGEIVPDDVIFREYEGINFVIDDFFCTACA